MLQHTKEKLLANECNKKRFIEMLKKALRKANICVQQAVEDADLMIVNTVISVAPQYDYVRVVGEDIDLLVLLTALASTHSNVFFPKVWTHLLKLQLKLNLTSLGCHQLPMLLNCMP
ncbi:hypothetical protein AVEN_108659-1 [Araneus ventricosus]|uniref:Uncharacterized protein n=1 Tax=Araneus ventricosus TaxID=182803 RepID=A0A4Y2PV65_ARAVE|nr:hypothetical protein AVEN_108659-1 [Araneus ventricosus]